jgi:hypothetical protein
VQRLQKLDSPEKEKEEPEATEIADAGPEDE